MGGVRQHCGIAPTGPSCVMMSGKLGGGNLPQLPLLSLLVITRNLKVTYCLHLKLLHVGNQSQTICLTNHVRCAGYKGPDESSNCLSQSDMSLHRWMQPINRQAPIKCVLQVPHMHSNTGVVRSHLLCDLCKRVRVTRWRSQTKVREGALQRRKSFQSKK